MLSAPGRSGARLPEKNVRARSKLPQKKCTGLLLPIKKERCCLNILSVCTRTRQKRLTYCGSYEECSWSSSHLMGFVTSLGRVLMVTSMPRERNEAINSQ